MSNRNESQPDNSRSSTAPGNSRGDGANADPPRQPEVAAQASAKSQLKGSEKASDSSSHSSHDDSSGQSGKQGSGGQGGKTSDQS